MNHNQSRSIDVDQFFCALHQKYIASIYADDPDVQTRRHTAIAAEPVNPQPTRVIEVCNQGDQAIMIEPDRTGASNR